MTNANPARKSLFVELLLVVIRAYQLLISPLLGPSCRFHPSCSRYTAECLELHGALRGSYLGVRRILRCHPWNPGGHDPPPLPRAHG
ncbi:MAG: membrane protein insertion efficiency factor YidD [Myxococcota bacterium]